MQQSIVAEKTNTNKSTKRPVSKRKAYHGKLKIIPLGGLEEVGRNLTALELNDKEIIIVDFGLGFPIFEEMPGIDFTLPNINYLEKNKEKILAILITHAHFDHIGAIPYLIDRIGNPPIYATPLSRGIILKRQKDFPNAPDLEIHDLRKDRYQQIKIGSFVVDYFHVNHNIPDSVGFFIQTPVGNIMHTGDFKIDFSPVFDKPADLSRVVKLALRGVRVLMVDSTNADHPGYLISEKKVMENLEEIVKRARGRIIAATFASLLERIQQLVWLAGMYGRRVVIDGYTMRNNVEVAKRLKYLQYPKGVFVKPEEAQKLPPHKVLIICTGSQAEEGSALMRIANGEHRYFKIIPGDTVIFSSSVIPGNERVIQELKDDLTKQGAKVVHYEMMDIHASGHACAEDVKLFINLVRPEYVMPVHGHYYMMKSMADIASSLGIPDHKILLAQNGQIVEVNPKRAYVTNKKVPSYMIYVDGLGIGDIKEVVLRDRQNLAKDGMMVVIVVIDMNTGKIRKTPDIISRGFVYLRESQELLTDIRSKIEEVVAKHVRFIAGESPIIPDEHIKYSLRESLADLVFQKTQRRPLIFPVVIKV